MAIGKVPHFLIVLVTIDECLMVNCWWVPSIDADVAYSNSLLKYSVCLQVFTWMMEHGIVVNSSASTV